MKRIGIDIQAIYGRRTGLGVYTQHLYDGMKSLNPAFDIIPIHSYIQDDLRTPIRIIYDQVEKAIKGYTASLDLYHIPAFSAPFLYRKKKIITCHDLIPLLYPASTSIYTRVYWQNIIYASVKDCDFVIANSEYTKKDIIETLHIHPDKITVIHLAPDTGFKPKEQIDTDILGSIKKKFNLPDRFLLYMGTIEARKNIMRLVEATKDVGIPLVIIGKKNPWITLPQASHVFYTGYVTDEEKIGILAMSSVFVMPSVYEGFCLPILEAMETGVPVVSSFATCMPEVGGDACLYFDPLSVDEMKAKIETMFNDRTLQQEYIKRGFENVKRFSWEATCKNTINLYTTVI